MGFRMSLATSPPQKEVAKASALDVSMCNHAQSFNVNQMTRLAALKVVKGGFGRVFNKLINR